jgi:hypothetical protein
MSNIKFSAHANPAPQSIKGERPRRCLSMIASENLLFRIMLARGVWVQTALLPTSDRAAVDCDEL